MRKLLGMAVEIGNPAVIAAIVSSVMAFVILTVKKFAIEPRRWRKNYSNQQFRKTAADIYGELITILKSCEHKAMRKHLDDTDPLKSNRVASHVLENSFDSNRLQEIFEKSPSYSLTLGKIIGAMVQIHNRG